MFNEANVHGASATTGTLREPLRDQVEQGTAGALLAALEEHDAYTARHSHSVVALARAVGIHLELSDEELAEVTLVALLHDIGKLSMPERVLRKRGPLTPHEREIMRDHSAAGARIVAKIRTLAHLAPAIRAGHERWDGTGYPDRLAGDAIPVASRITFVCDAYDAMTSARPYREAMTPEHAREELVRGAGTQFCGRCVAALLDVLDPATELAARG